MSLCKLENGRYAVELWARGKKQARIFIGTTSRGKAEGIRRHIEALDAHIRLGHDLATGTVEWRNNLCDPMYARLVKAGLAKPRVKNEVAVGLFTAAYIDSREGADAAPGTIRIYRQARGYLVDFFGENRPIQSISKGDATEFRRWLLAAKPKGRGLEESTALKACSIARTFLGHAVDCGFIHKNPFAKMNCSFGSNRSKRRFVERGEIDTLIDKAPNGDC